MLSVIGQGLLGAIGGWAQGQDKQIDVDQQNAEKEKLLGMTLDSKNELQNQMLSAKSDMQQQMLQEREKFQAILDSQRRDKESDLNDYRKGLLDTKQQQIDLQGQVSSARMDAAAARLAAGQGTAAAKEADRQQAMGDRENNQNDRQIQNAQLQATRDFTAIANIKDSDQKAKRYSQLGVDPNDPDADTQLQAALEQQRLTKLPKKTLDYARSQSIDPYPFASMNSAKGTAPSGPSSSATPAPTTPMAGNQADQDAMVNASGGASPASGNVPKPSTPISPGAIQYLKQNAQNPAMLAAFKTKYGVDPTTYLGQ